MPMREKLAGSGMPSGATGAALGRPDAAGTLAEVLLMRGDGDTNLCAEAFVGAEQRHVAVGGGAGDDLEDATVSEGAEAGDNIAVEGFELLECVAEEALPEARGLGIGVLAHREEEGLVLAGGGDFALEVAGELGPEDRMRELLEEDGREGEVELECYVVALETIEGAQQREIGFGCGFEEPFDSVRPAAVVDDVGQMRVQGDGEKPTRLEWLSHSLNLRERRPASARVGGAGALLRAVYYRNQGSVVSVVRHEARARPVVEAEDSLAVGCEMQGARRT